MGGDVLQRSFVERGGEQGAQTVTRQIGCKVKDGRWGDGVEMTLCNLGVSKCRIEQVQLSLPREMNLLHIKICHKEVLSQEMPCRCFLMV